MIFDTIGKNLDNVFWKLSQAQDPAWSCESRPLDSMIDTLVFQIILYVDVDIRKSGITLDPSEIPYDTTFVIEECGSKVKAHKLIMAMSSPVCMKQFYGELKEINSDIVIKGATKDAFITMIDYFYGKKVDWKKKTQEEFFEIANLKNKLK